MLRVTAEKFHEQVIAAITSVKEIYTLGNVPLEPSVSRESITEQLLDDNGIDFSNINQVNKIITQDDTTDKPPSVVERDLEDLTAEYDTALEIFKNLENVDYGSSQIVAKTTQPARCLTVKMLLLAKEIQANPPKPSNPRRVLISLKLKDLQQQYREAESSGNTTKIAEIKRQVAEQIDEWLKINAAEKKLIEDSITQLVIAADTGSKLSKLIDEYSDLDFEVIATRVTQIVGVTSSLTGKDYSSVLTKMRTVETTINSDPTLRDFLRDVSIKTRLTPTSQPKLCQELG
ncbi:hypothetical protein [Nostoc sp. CMAA1605]|uniref:hypothetical protein n=1 Tax=Nostoc sp. CMAA1605 TaxID=2055159 RepID=UPI001F45CEE8|nr:hypothetical protein [Nostoc sp. CMAA1605]MCF4967569.1 hypothetical protein [Nostoc sp. CMAA1605]